MAVNAAQIYQGNKINTASPAELTLMLYEGAIKFCNLAILGIESGDIQKAHTNIMKVQNIILEFKASLNHKYSVSKDFEVVYDVIHQNLIQANVKKDKEVMEQVLVQLRDLRDIWKEVMKSVKTA